MVAIRYVYEGYRKAVCFQPILHTAGGRARQLTCELNRRRVVSLSETLR